jgi:hypothetical protein
MSNLLTKFPSRLTQVIHTIAKNGTHIYTASFEDGSTHVIRTSGRVYASVSQCWYWTREDGNTEFLFSSKLSPALKSGERNRHITTVRIYTPEAK